jgi:hypothetical protein
MFRMMHQRKHDGRRTEARAPGSAAFLGRLGSFFAFGYLTKSFRRRSASARLP